MLEDGHDVGCCLLVVCSAGLCLVEAVKNHVLRPQDSVNFLLPEKHTVRLGSTKMIDPRTFFSTKNALDQKKLLE